jgi:5-methylthioadenosine/S-adenosylhomocysteine deaminase
MREMGVRGIMYQEVFGPDPAMRNDSLRELEAQLAGHRQRVTDLVQVGVSPHAPYSVSAPLFAAVGELARREGLPAAIHAAESDDEDRFVRDGDGPWANSHRKRGIEVQAHGCSPVELLRRSGVLRAAPLLIHCVKTSESDVRTIAETGCAVAHCPVSNTTLGHGIAPLTEFLDAKIRVGLGSDSMASNTRMNLFDEVRAALHGQQHRNGRTLSAAHLLELATLGGARSLGLGDRIGSLEVGKDADLAAFPLHAPGHDPVNSLLTAGDARATLVTVKGSELVRDGRVLADDAQLHERVANAAGRLTRWRASQP